MRSPLNMHSALCMTALLSPKLACRDRQAAAKHRHRYHHTLLACVPDQGPPAEGQAAGALPHSWSGV